MSSFIVIKFMAGEYILRLTKHNVFAAIMTAFLIVLLFAPAIWANPATEVRTDFLMDTFIEQQLIGRNAKKAGSEVYAALRELENELSLYNADSEIAAVNTAAGKSYVKVSPQTYALLKRSCELSSLSCGAFDITIGSLTTLWHSAKEAGIPPTATRLAEPQRLVDYRNVLFDDSTGSVKLAEAGMALDPGGIAKGYACEIVRKIYEENKLQTALISIGGNVCTYKAPRGKSYYRVGIKNPDVNGENPLLVLNTKDEVIATSGAYERYFTYNGTVYHHIIDKKTAMPAQSDLLSVTIVTSDGTLADYLSTTLFVLGKKAVLKAIAQEGTAPQFMVLAIDKNKNIYASSGLLRRLELLDDKNYRFAADLS